MKENKDSSIFLTNKGQTGSELHMKETGETCILFFFFNFCFLNRFAITVKSQKHCPLRLISCKCRNERSSVMKRTENRLTASG